MFSKKIALPMAAVAMASFVACDSESSSSPSNLTSCYIESAFFGSTCYEVSNVYADSVKANCLADGVFITKASIGSGCPSGAVKSCEEVEDGVPGTAYYYGDLYKRVSCEELVDDDDDEEEDPRNPLNQDGPANNSNVGPEENEIPTVDPVENPVVEPVTPADDPVAEPVDPVTPTDDPVVEPVEPVTPVADGPVCYMASDVPGMAECISITAEQCAMIMGEWVDACPIN